MLPHSDRPPGIIVRAPKVIAEKIFRDGAFGDSGIGKKRALAKQRDVFMLPASRIGIRMLLIPSGYSGIEYHSLAPVATANKGLARCFRQ